MSIELGFKLLYLGWTCTFIHVHDEFVIGLGVRRFITFFSRLIACLTYPFGKVEGGEGSRLLIKEELIIGSCTKYVRFEWAHLDAKKQYRVLQ